MKMIGVGEVATTLMTTKLAGTRYEDDCFPGTKRAYIPGSKHGGIKLVASQWRRPPLQSQVWLPVARGDATWSAVLTSLHKKQEHLAPGTEVLRINFSCNIGRPVSMMNG